MKSNWFTSHGRKGGSEPRSISRCCLLGDGSGRPWQADPGFFIFHWFLYPLSPKASRDRSEETALWKLDFLETSYYLVPWTVWLAPSMSPEVQVSPVPFYRWRDWGCWGWGTRAMWLGREVIRTGAREQEAAESVCVLEALNSLHSGNRQNLPDFIVIIFKSVYSSRCLRKTHYKGHSLLLLAGPGIHAAQLLLQRLSKPMKASCAHTLSLQYGFRGENRAKSLTAPPSPHHPLINWPQNRGLETCPIHARVPSASAHSPSTSPRHLCSCPQKNKTPIFAYKAGEGSGELTSELRCY